MHTFFEDAARKSIQMSIQLHKYINDTEPTPFDVVKILHYSDTELELVLKYLKITAVFSADGCLDFFNTSWLPLAAPTKNDIIKTAEQLLTS
jgi:hypothetical protein